MPYIGTGYATMTIVFLLDVYYCVIVAWTLFYLASCFISFPTLPWENCSKIYLENNINEFQLLFNDFVPILFVSDNWWNTKNCLNPNGVNTTHELFSTDTIKRMFNTSLTLNGNLESWNRIYFNESYALQNTFFKNDSPLTTFCQTLKSLSAEDPQNFTGTGLTNRSSSILDSGKSVDFLNQLRNCFNVTTVTPAEEYWECVKSADIFFFYQIFIGWDIFVGDECSC